MASPSGRERDREVVSAGAVVFGSGQTVLLVHRPRYDDWSFPKGKLDRGEHATAAAVREVEEETGVRVRDVRYVASQPWPFPASLMLGFRAVCDGDADPHPRDGELEDARWFTRDELRVQTGALLPTPVSIAWRLITDWLDGV